MNEYLLVAPNRGRHVPTRLHHASHDINAPMAIHRPLVAAIVNASTQKKPDNATTPPAPSHRLDIPPSRTMSFLRHPLTSIIANLSGIAAGKYRSPSFPPSPLC